MTDLVVRTTPFEFDESVAVHAATRQPELCRLVQRLQIHRRPVREVHHRCAASTLSNVEAAEAIKCSHRCQSVTRLR